MDIHVITNWDIAHGVATSVVNSNRKRYLLSNEECEDLKSEATIAAMELIKQFDARRGIELESFLRWRVGKRLHRWLSRLRNGGITGDSKDTAWSGDLADVDEMPDISALRRDFVSDLDTALDVDRLLDSLTTEERILLEKYYGVSVDEPASLRALAEQYEVSHETIRVQISEILEKLQKKLTKPA